MAKRTLSQVAKKIDKGGLHRSLGIPAGQKIPAKDLAVKPTDSPKVVRQKNLAKTFARARKG